MSSPSEAAPDSVVYRIHPSIGVARLGDSPDGFFVGPEVPGHVSTEPRKKNGRIVRQAARFRLFAYRREGATLVLDREVLPGTAGVVSIRWTVHLANRKAAFFEFAGLKGEAGRYHAGEDVAPAPRRNGGDPADWEIDPGARSVSGAHAGPVRFDAASGGRFPVNAAGTAVVASLGELRTDAEGRLLVLGGHGVSGSTVTPPAPLPSYANNPTWLDDVSDGPVTAEVIVANGGATKSVPVERDGQAWCLVAPPDFAPEVTGVVTLYDVLVDMATRKLDLPQERVYSTELAWLGELNGELRGGALSLARYRPDYERDVFPLIERALQFRWVHQAAANAHSDIMTDPALADPGDGARAVREQVFRRLREPAVPATPGASMPRLLGDEPYEDHPQAPHTRRLAVTRTQYAILERWRDGAFDPPAEVPVPGRARTVDPTAITPWGLDRAALEGCVGGGFYPGIEAGWQMRHEDLFIAPFRVAHDAPSTYLGDVDVVRAGHFSRQMAVPWQADFMDCRLESHNGADVPAVFRGSWGWWPSQRPDEVRVAGSTGMVPWTPVSADHDWMVANWAKLGFVLRIGTTDAFVQEP